MTRFNSFPLLFALALAAASPATAALLTLIPSANPVLVGQTVTVELRVDAIAGLASWQADLNFNSSVLQFVSWSNGTFVNLDQMLAPAVDNTAGLVSGLGAFSSLLTGLDGPGTLGALTFTATAAGISGLVPTGLIFLDSNLADLEVTPSSLSLVVSDPPVTGVPEPGSFWLLGGLLAMGRWPRGRRGIRARHAARWPPMCAKKTSSRSAAAGS